MKINNKNYKFNCKKLLRNIGILITYSAAYLLCAYMFTNMLIALIEKYN